MKSDEANKAMVEMDGFTYEAQRIIVEKAETKVVDRRGQGPKEIDLCYNCGKSGHWYNFTH